MSTMHEGLRFTRYGSPSVEQRIGKTMARAADLVAKHFDRHECRALVLMGGYGRGEGGVIQECGEERPHNNLDFLLVTSPLQALQKKTLKKRLDDIFAPIVREERLGIDTGVISDYELRIAPPRVIWFDLRWGHRTILGDAAMIPSLAPVSAREIEIDDVHQLLVNRASLLVINDAIIERGIISDVHAQFMIKHLMKAIIGHGDALLFARGRYHASYLEKQRRMRECPDIVPGLAALYDIAAEFRFAPDYARYEGSNLAEFIARVRDVLSQAHLEFERFRTNNPHCTFDGHAERVLYDQQTERSLFERSKRLAKSWSSWRTYRAPKLALPPKLALAVRNAQPCVLLRAALPAVLYETSDEQQQIAQTILGATACTPRALRDAYLHHWSRFGDPNFVTTAKRLGLGAKTMESLS
jgi:hypothetical protein